MRFHLKSNHTFICEICGRTVSEITTKQIHEDGVLTAQIQLCDDCLIEDHHWDVAESLRNYYG